jgi:hypothetical protein
MKIAEERPAVQSVAPIFKKNRMASKILLRRASSSVLLADTARGWIIGILSPNGKTALSEN